MNTQKPLSAAKRAVIINDLRAGLGRNETARRNDVAAGTVTSVARSIGHYFPRCEHTVDGTKARQADQALERLYRAEELWDTFLNTPPRHDGTLTRRAERASRALDRIHATDRRSTF